jgi:HPt (histidine-containing phosphotransfer) domain-containing protein
MNGLVAAAEIRRLGDGRGPAIVAVTAETGDAWRQRCLLAGINDVLEKPVRTHVLAGILNRYARTRSAALADHLGAHHAGGLAVGPARRAHARLDEARPAGDREARRAGGIDELIADVGLELTLELAREYITGVSRALETVATGDLAATRRDAHRLLGSARTLSLARFERLWLRVEDLASLPEEIPPATIDELRRARVELERWIERHHEKHCA